MRVLSGSGSLVLVVPFGLATAACGALSGISAFDSVTGPADGGARLVDAGGNPPPGAGEDTSTGDDVQSDAEPVEAGDDAIVPVGDDAGDHAPDDAADLPDVEADAAPACGAMTCGGCCLDGTCHGGASVDTCGRGGVTCHDCTSEGACSAAGACATPVVDAGATKTCNPSQCPLSCIPVYQGACCKSDQTCGCQVVIPKKGSCG
jgi:hypothetical protein